MVTIVNNTELYCLKVAKRVDLKSSHYKKQNLEHACVVTDVKQTYCGDDFTMYTNIKSCCTLKLI